MPKKRPYHHGDLKRVLIDAAARLIEHGDVAGLSLREVARSAGVSHAAPYHHFKSKDALLGSVGASGFYKLAAQFLETTKDLIDPVEQLLVFSSETAAFAEKNPGLYRVMFRLLRTHEESSEEGMKAGQELLAILVRAVGAAQTSGRLPEGNATDLALRLWAAVHGVITLNLYGPLGALGLTDSDLPTRAREEAEYLVLGLQTRIGSPA